MRTFPCGPKLFLALQVDEPSIQYIDSLASADLEGGRLGSLHGMYLSQR